MKLKDYIDRFPEFDLLHFSRNLGVARATLWKAIQGKKMDIEVALKIQNGTAGIVTCDDLVGDALLKKKRKENTTSPSAIENSENIRVDSKEENSHDI